jgi:extradiol dioxygenase family protein
MLQQSPMYVYIPAKDMARARKFYEGQLGFVVKEETNGGVVYEFGQHTACFLYPHAERRHIASQPGVLGGGRR